MAQDFQSACKNTLKLLRDRLGFDLWMITRTEGNDWIVLSTEDHGYGIPEGAIMEWQDSLCSRMIQGLGPSVAPEVGLIPAYTSAPLSQQINIGAYIGVPLTTADGRLFGTLCAVDPRPHTDDLLKEQALIELMANLLSSILDAELKTIDAVRRAERAEAEATRDSLTNLYNRLGWTQLIQKEENRCHRYGHPACVINIDVDGLKEMNDSQGHAAGDDLLIRCSQALLEATRTSDVVARLGGDEFCVLGVECDPTSAKIMERRIRTCLANAGVNASVGLAIRTEQGLAVACAEADEKMYIEKRSKKSSAENKEPSVSTLFNDSKLVA